MLNTNPLGFIITTVAASMWLVSSPLASAEQSNVMVILDASNSMWGQIDGQRKIDVAKDVLVDMVRALPDRTSVGLVAYGHGHHHKEKNCKDIALIAGYDDAQSGQFERLLETITPRGQTPIAAALERSADWVVADGIERPTVVLITDGVESCNGDPCAAAGKLASAGIKTTIHVVGYDLKDDQRAAVDCISREGGGSYFDARDTKGLRTALEQVTIDIAQVTTAPQQEEAPKLIFEDDFDGDTLSHAWTVLNENEDAFIVEGGQLLMVGSGEQGLWVEQSANIFRLDNALPTGDWDINVDLKIDLQTGEDSFELGLFRDDQNYLAANVYHHRGDWCHKLEIALFKRVKGKQTSASSLISSNSGHCGQRVHGDVDPVVAALNKEGLRLTLSKRAREYYATVILKGVLDDGDPRLVQTPSLTSLRAPGQPVITIGNYKDVDGEVPGYVDRIEIVAVR
ncbi:MAG: VWA domain-containing protein [Alphaproteobacteria bacterium]|nr:VWA domain-containing protein [Alphaproteobacteria bacterium]